MRVFSANGLVALVPISQIAADEKGASLKASLGIGRRAASRPGWVGMDTPCSENQQKWIVVIGLCYHASMRSTDDPLLRRFRATLDEIYGQRLERVALYGS